MTKARELSELGSYVNVSDGVTSVNNITVTSNLQLTTVVANGSVGTAGQVLSSNGSVVYWTTPSTGSVVIYSRSTGSVTIPLVSGTFNITGRTGNIPVYLQQT